jgi:Replication protein
VLRSEALRRILWRVTAVRRLWGCGRFRIGTNVEVVAGPGGARFRGLETCGSIWSCPPCAGRKRALRAAQLREGLSAWIADGMGAELLTLTVGHGMGDRLDEVWTVLAKAWSAVVQSKYMRDLRSEVRFFGYVKATEVTYGEHGWHPHLHVILLFPDQLGKAEQTAFMAEVAEIWGGRVRGLGHKFTSDAMDMVQIRSGKDAEAVVDYVLDVTAANEVLRSDAKKGRGESVSPWELLELAGTGDERYRAAWSEWEVGSAGRRAVTFSRGAAVLLAVPEEDPEVSADEDAPPLAVVDRESWDDVVLKHPLGHAVVLEAASAGEQTAVLLALAWLRADIIGEAWASVWWGEPEFVPEQLELLLI